MSFEEFAKKKVLGVPVLYIGLVAVVILGIVAWRLKPAPEQAVLEQGGMEDTDPLVGAGSDYSGLATQGTVTVVQGGTTTDTETEVAKQTNDDWFRSAVDYLVKDEKVTPTDAQEAINNYLEGADLTYDQGRYKDMAIRKLGLPPERLSAVGKVGTAPAQKQFSLFPGTHTVKGVNDNTPAKLATLYYGNSGALYVDKIVSENYRLGGAATTYQPGVKVIIPTWYTPRYVTVTKATQYPSSIAAKNGMTYQEVEGLNPNARAPYPIGSKIRVR